MAPVAGSATPPRQSGQAPADIPRFSTAYPQACPWPPGSAHAYTRLVHFCRKHRSMSARSGFRSNRRERGDGFDRDRDESRIDQLRVPPHSVEAEQAVLGGLMLAPEAYDRVNDQLTEGDFYRRDHQMIYRAIRELSERERPFDAVTLGEWFESQGKLELVGDGAYLIELASTTPRCCGS
ncbi:hypothetical protein G6F35_010557 [Rhizopus arrhizus]|nr:hypothetical protein G6F35_010557 [Rhizopus arrhizus]